MSLMVKYGLRPGTLKGELFKVLLEQGIHGLKVSELAKSLEISSSTYRVRINSSEKKVEESQLDTEDSGAVDDDLGESGTCSNDDDFGCNSGNSKIKKLTYMNHGKRKDNMVIVYTEIDESHPGKVWLLGLMEGEYSDLSIEEKLSAIVAPIDLLYAGSSFRMEDPINAIAECIPSSLHFGSGAKIKRLSTKQHGMPRPTWIHAGHTSGAKEDYTLKFHPIDSSGSISKFSDEIFSTKEKNEKKEKCGLTYAQCNLCFWGLIVDTIDTGFSWALVMHMTPDIEGFISNLQKMVTGR
ncbi:hypothetical protein Pyn_23967 [Prunus yedoensis var. nudiflora]|uniref:WHIM1 domain-containing protein n=1 Tax=Prunus yedoensis var. nudiflora TaxID=2094558 RepID=A0A314UVE6_PRUYE|nr:hypothetical protein Pyn_23967 [Prunus yedoensis var. nudiflora]